MQKYAIIVAAGKGERMGSSLPKQFMLLNGVPILMHVLQKFYDSDKKFKIILTLPEKTNLLEKWYFLCEKYNCSIPHVIVPGGETRFESVKKSLEKIEGEGLVAIHDGVRPLVSIKLIKECIGAVRKDTCSVPIIPLKNSIRKIKNKTSISLNRSNLFSVQTPQCFNVDEIKKAYTQNYSSDFTDDATVFQKNGGTIKLISGEENNIKITTKTDLKLAHLL